MSKPSRTFRNFLLLSVVFITLLTFLNQFYVSEHNQILKRELVSLTQKTSALEKDNSELKNSLLKNQKVIENVVKEKSQISSPIVDTLALRYLENRENKLSVEQSVSSLQANLLQNPSEVKNKAYLANNELAKVPALVPNNANLINILAIGKNGGLTDSIMIVSINKLQKKISLVSIPRDYWDTKYKEKINRIYKKYGIDTFKESIERLTLLKINRMIEVDFTGFSKIVDHLDGIWVYNEKNIYDKSYPSENYKYEIFSLKSGYQKLDGKTALKFARTRHTDSDYKRAGRQQEVLNGLLNAFRKLDYTDISKIINVIREIITYTKTDISVFEGLEYLSDFREFTLKGGNVLNVPTHLYPDHNFYGEYISLPRDPSLKHIHNYISEIVN